ncbi:recombinase family protein [Chryseobacterium sp. 3008163]|uniref:recombinase family protein n=1 Tax=Chryseobacterium sp. 3008163 TaxID=2478663 RepID=UPI001E38DFED|nr:recombinase family protein [Chryseobacterium sp. 3008163]
MICSRSHFFRVIRNPIYCGLISIKLNSNEEQMIKGLHESLISESLFYQVQSLISTKIKTTGRKEDLRGVFF